MFDFHLVNHDKMIPNGVGGWISAICRRHVIKFWILWSKLSESPLLQAVSLRHLIKYNYLFHALKKIMKKLQKFA